MKNSIIVSWVLIYGKPCFHINSLQSIESLFSHEIVEVAIGSKAVVVFPVVWSVGARSGSPLLKSPHFVLVKKSQTNPLCSGYPRSKRGEDFYLCNIMLNYSIF